MSCWYLKVKPLLMRCQKKKGGNEMKMTIKKFKKLSYQNKIAYSRGLLTKQLKRNPQMNILRMKIIYGNNINYWLTIASCASLIMRNKCTDFSLRNI